MRLLNKLEWKVAQQLARARHINRIKLWRKAEKSKVNEENKFKFEPIILIVSRAYAFSEFQNFRVSLKWSVVQIGRVCSTAVTFAKE